MSVGFKLLWSAIFALLMVAASGASWDAVRDIRRSRGGRGPDVLFVATAMAEVVAIIVLVAVIWVRL